MSRKNFVNGNERIERLISQVPAEEIEKYRAEVQGMNREYAMTLAMVREAARRTQVEIARELNVTQSTVSQLENSDNMLLSTLRNYLTATGATNPRILVTVNGHDVELDI